LFARSARRELDLLSRVKILDAATNTLGFAALQSPFGKAEAFSVHDLIHPRETRSRLCDWIELVRPCLMHQLGPPQFSFRP
jgi:hypothetical protein